MAKNDDSRCNRCGTRVVHHNRKGRRKKYCQHCADIIRRKSGCEYHVCLCGNRRSKDSPECKSCSAINLCKRCGKPCQPNSTCSDECRDWVVANKSRSPVNVVVSCANCGSMKTIREADVRRKQSDNIYCDIECAGEHKRWLYLSDEHQVAFAIIAGKKHWESMIRRDREEFYTQILRKGWKCCVWCDAPFNGNLNTKFCSGKCSRRLMLAMRRKQYEKDSRWHTATCKHCSDLFSYRRHKSAGTTTQLFCSTRCCERSHKQNRSHLIRSAGYSHTIRPVDVFKRDRWKCKACGCRCVRSKGKNIASEATLDHIHPLSIGGLHVMPNVQTLCRRCNTAKGAKMDGQQLTLGLQ